MTEYFSSEPQFLFEEAQERTTPAFTNERWIEMVLINPLSIVPKISTTSTYRENFSDRELTALYADWQTRDSEIGYDIVERRKRELQSGIELYKQALDRRNRSLAMARARLQTIQRINSNEPDKKLHYPTSAIDELQREIAATETELAYLRRYMSRMAALNGVIQMLNASGRSDMVERYYRLIGQAWRGEMKLRAFQARFQITLPKEDPNNPILGQIIANTIVESPFGREVVVSDLTLSYLHHQLSIIALLSERTRLLFDPAEQAAQLSGEWPAAMVLLSAIVELFYFCSFEMTISSHARLVEK
ncbi:MAG: hypothetical protein JNN15_20980, partial [Blastocatellia bacterium]|nr:hypothetical protein [Blastocatellia bacterium]